MMQATHFWDFLDQSNLWELYRPLQRTIHVQRPVRAPVMIILEVTGQEVSQMPLVQNDHVVQPCGAENPARSNDVDFCPGVEVRRGWAACSTCSLDRTAGARASCRHIAGAFLSCGACPQLRAGDACALREGTELRPGNRRHHGGRTSEGREAAVDACDDILAPHDVRIARDALGDELRVLDEVGRRVDHARDEAFPVGQLHFFEDGPFVLMTRVSALEADRRGPCLQHRLDDLTQRNVVIVRALIVAPAEMEAHTLGRDVFGRGVEHLEV